MSASTLTDAQIQILIACSKRVANPGSKPHTEGKHVRRDYRAASVDGIHSFIVFTRQSTLISNSFTAGLRWRSKSGEDIILLRCNGSDHPHGNALERTQFVAQQHVHIATERYVIAGRKAECYAEPTSAYSTLSGALHQLAQMANIAGLSTQADELDLFD